MIIFGVIFIIANLSGGAASAGEADDLVKQAKTELRGAQGAMFNGKIDDATAELTKALETIEAVKKADAAHKELKKLEGDAEKLRKDIERRTKKPFEPAAKGEGAGKVPAAATAAGGDQKMPFHAADKMMELKDMLRSIDSTYGMIDSYKERGEDPEKMKTKLGEIEKKIATLKPTLEEAKKLAAEKGINEHPEFAEAEKAIEAANKRLAESKGATDKLAADTIAAKETVQKDVDALLANFKRADKFFQKATGTAIYYNDLKSVEECLAIIKEFEKTEKDKLAISIAEFSKKYGETEAEIDKKADAVGYTGNWRAGSLYTKIKDGIVNIEKTRSAMAEDLTAKAREMITRLPEKHDFAREDIHKTVRQYRNLAAEFDAVNAKVKDLDAELEKLLADDLKALEKKIDGREWKSVKKGFEKETEAGLKFLRECEDWGKRKENPYTVIAASVLGDWTVQEKDILGKPIMYGVPAWIAVQLEPDKAANRVRVFSIYFRTAEGANVKPIPPFTSITVGDSFFMRPEAIKKATEKVK